MSDLDQGIAGWQAEADRLRRNLELGVCLVPSVAHVNIDLAERCVKALKMEKNTGVSVCIQCFKPFALNNRGYHSCVG